MIQNDVDIPLSPSPGDTLIAPSGWTQFPKAECDTCQDNPTAMAINDSTVTIIKG